MHVLSLSLSLSLCPLSLSCSHTFPLPSLIQPACILCKRKMPRPKRKAVDSFLHLIHMSKTYTYQTTIKILPSMPMGITYLRNEPIDQTLHSIGMPPQQTPQKAQLQQVKGVMTPFCSSFSNIKMHASMSMFSCVNCLRI